MGSAGAKRRKNTIAGAFAARPIAMLESPAYRVLSLGARRVIDRLEIEHSHHGGKENGALPVTFEDFREYGLSLRLIAPAIREAEALGFIQVMRRGCAGPAEFRQPSLYRLTYRHAKAETGDGSHEWKGITSLEQAEAIAASARLGADPHKVQRGKVTEARRATKASRPGAASVH